MFIKETIYTEVDEFGRAVRRTRETEIYDSSTDYGYDYGTRYGGYGNPRRSSTRRMMDAYEDDCRCREW